MEFCTESVQVVRSTRRKYKMIIVQMNVHGMWNGLCACGLWIVNSEYRQSTITVTFPCARHDRSGWQMASIFRIYVCIYIVFCRVITLNNNNNSFHFSQEEKEKEKERTESEKTDGIILALQNIFNAFYQKITCSMIFVIILRFTKRKSSRHRPKHELTAFNFISAYSA